MENPNGIVQGNDQNVPEAHIPRTRSTFPLDYHFFDTHRFGEYHPHYVAEGVKGDILPIRSSHEVLSYTLKAPLMQKVQLNKDYFLVPKEAILPLNWDKFFENPVRGDDVDVKVGPTVPNFFGKYGHFCDYLYYELCNRYDPSSSDADKLFLQATLRFLIICEYVYSNGSLLASLGCHGAPYLKIVCSEDGQLISFDSFFDVVVSEILSFLSSGSNKLFSCVIDSAVYDVFPDGLKKYDLNAISFRHALSLMRDDPHFVITSVSSSLRSLFSWFQSEVYTLEFVQDSIPINLSKLWAYQLVCAHYYSNDHVDFTYSANLYRQLIRHYVTRSIVPDNPSTLFFEYNGLRYEQDYMSSAYFTEMMIRPSLASLYPSLLTGVEDEWVNCFLGYLSALFAFRRSLRYVDYFTGSRTTPLAVGSVGVEVVRDPSTNQNMVDVVDVTRNIQKARFLNAVNRVRHNFEGYLKGIFGGDTPAPDYHNPFYLAHTGDVIFGQETENTAEAQMSQQIAITTNLRSNGSRYMLEIHCDRPCILIGISSYDIPRVYSKTIERDFFHVDRFDEFNPFMQYVGDQPVYRQELGINIGVSGLPTSLNNFAYQLRHMEYKQRYNQAAGGFIEFLPGFAFVTDIERGSQRVLNPDWIRSVPAEFDRFYISLTGYSLASYFHFIVNNFNDCSGSRPMAYAPSILS